MTIAFVCRHLTGAGHLVRTLALARAALRLGYRAVVISVSRLSKPGPTVRLVQR